jgi:hypothetical protein
MASIAGADTTSDVAAMQERQPLSCGPQVSMRPNAATVPWAKWLVAVPRTFAHDSNSSRATQGIFWELRTVNCDAAFNPPPWTRSTLTERLCSWRLRQYWF